MSRFKKYEEIVKEYGNKYQVKRGKDGIYYLEGRYGRITPYDEAGKYLLAVCYFRTKRLKNARMKKLYDYEFWFEVTQEGDSDVCFKFEKNSDVRATLRFLKRVLNLHDRKVYRDGRGIKCL